MAEDGPGRNVVPVVDDVAEGIAVPARRHRLEEVAGHSLAAVTEAVALDLTPSLADDPGPVVDDTLHLGVEAQHLTGKLAVAAADVHQPGHPGEVVGVDGGRPDRH